MKATRPETHLLRELQVLSSPFVVLAALLSARFIDPEIGPAMLLQTFSIMFVVALLAFLSIAAIRTRRLTVRVRVWSAIVSAIVNATAVGSLAIAFRIWYYQWPFNQEPIQPETYIDDAGAAWLITLGLTALSSLIWVLGIFAVGATPARELKSKPAAE